MSNDHLPGLASAFLFGLIFSVFYLESWAGFVLWFSPLVTLIVVYYTSGRELLGLSALFAIAYHGVCHAPAALVARGIHSAGFTPPSHPGNRFVAGDDFIYNIILLGGFGAVVGAVFWSIAAGIAKKIDEEPF